MPLRRKFSYPKIRWKACILRGVNPFVPNAPFLYPLKVSEGEEKGCIVNEWIK